MTTDIITTVTANPVSDDLAAAYERGYREMKEWIDQNVPKAVMP